MNMKTIIENGTNISKYIFEDAHDLVATAENITCPHFVICDMNSTNAAIITGVTPPEDWGGCKYSYEGGIWTLNPDWVDPAIEAEVITNGT